MNALLFSVVSLLEAVVTYSIGATLIVLGVLAIVSGSRCLLNGRGPTRGSRAVRLLRRGTGSLALVGVLTVGLTAVLAGLAVWSR
jgi:hypothetical protein